MWREILGSFAYQATTAGTITLPKNATITRIAVHASAGSATLVILGYGVSGYTAIPIIENAPPLDLQYNHDMLHCNVNGYTVVGTNTDMLLVEYFVTP